MTTTPRAEHAETQDGGSLSFVTDPATPGRSITAGTRTPDVLEVQPGAVCALETHHPAIVARLFRACAGLATLPPGWSVSLDGRALTTLPSESRRTLFHVVSPELPLLRRSVERNLRDVTENPDDAARCAVFSTCGLDNDAELAHLGRRKLSEGGRGLSPNLDARLRLARALLACPAVLLVDDPIFLNDTDARSALATAALERRIPTLVLMPRNGAVPDDWTVLHPDAPPQLQLVSRP